MSDNIEVVDELKGTGIKYDEDKPRVAEFIADFGDVLLELTKVWVFGATKYGISNWKHVKNGKMRFTNAMMRHYIAEAEKETDDETGLLHANHLAFNALMRLHFMLEEKKNK